MIESRKHNLLKPLIFIVISVVLLITLPNVYLTFELPKAAFFKAGVLILMLISIIKILKENEINFIKSPRKLPILIGIYIASQIVSLIVGISPETSFFGSYERQQGLMQLLFYVMFFLMFIYAFAQEKTQSSNKNPLTNFIENISLVAFFIASLAILQKFLLALTSIWNMDILNGRESIGTLGSPNFLGTYLAMSMPFFYLNFKNSDTKTVKRFFWIIASVIAITAIIFTASRGALFGLTTGVVFYSTIKNKKFLIIPLIFAIVIFLANIFSQNSLIKDSKILSRFTVNEENAGSIKSRLLIWPATIKMIIQKPLFGYGQENFKEAFSAYAPKELLMTERFTDVIDRAHNEILDTMANSGIFGLLAYLSMFFYMIFLGIKSKSEISILSSTALISLFSANMFGFSTTVHNMLFWTFAGIIVVESFPKMQQKLQRLKNITKIFIYVLVITIISKLAWTVSISPLVADYYYDKAISSSINFDKNSSAEYFKKAVLFNPKNEKYEIKAAEYFTTFEKDKGLATWFMEKAKNSLAKDTATFFYISAKLDILNGDYNSAILKLKIAHEKAATNPKILIYYARTLADAKQYKESLKIYEEYLNLVPIWKNAATTKMATQKEKDQFRIFFKNAPQFVTAIDEAANIAGMLGDTEKYTYYKNAQNVIKSVLREINPNK